MELHTLIREAINLINSANQKAVAGSPDEARAHLVTLRDLLNEQLELDADDDQVIEEKLNPSED